MVYPSLYASVYERVNLEVLLRHSIYNKRNICSVVPESLQLTEWVPVCRDHAVLSLLSFNRGSGTTSTVC